MPEAPVIDNAPANYQAVDAESQKAINAKRGPSRLWRIANKFGLAGLVASIGIAGTSVATDQTPLEVTKDVASAAGDAAAFTADRIGERVDTLRDDIRNGTPDQNDPRNR